MRLPPTSALLKHRLLLSGLLFLSPLPALAEKIALTIASDPAGATVLWNGKAVGTTPYTANLPGGYFHETAWVTSTVLGTAVNIVLLKPGYRPERLDITNGPFDRQNLKGQYFGQFWIITDTHFHQNLVPRSPATASRPPSPLGAQFAFDNSGGQPGRYSIKHVPDAASEHTGELSITGVGIRWSEAEGGNPKKDNFEATCKDVKQIAITAAGYMGEYGNESRELRLGVFRKQYVLQARSGDERDEILGALTKACVAPK